MTKFFVTCTEQHAATYEFEAETRAEAMDKWLSADWSEAKDRELIGSADITVEELGE